MRSRHEISMDYQRALSMTRELEQLANQLRQAGREKPAGTIRSLSSSWSGENASAFIAKALNGVEKTEEYVQFITKTASQIRSNAQRVYQAEMQALMIAEQRNYN